jgi:hypothetical protein
VNSQFLAEITLKELPQILNPPLPPRTPLIAKTPAQPKPNGKGKMKFNQSSSRLLKLN